MKGMISRILEGAQRVIKVIYAFWFVLAAGGALVYACIVILEPLLPLIEGVLIVGLMSVVYCFLVGDGR